MIGNFWNVETPAWLVSVGEVDRAKKNIMYIAKWNGVKDLQIHTLLPDPEPTGDDDEPPADSSRKFVGDEIVEENDSLADKKPVKQIGFCSSRKLCITLVVFITFWTVSSFNYYLLTF